MGAGLVCGRLHEAGAGWMLLVEHSGREVLVCLQAVMWVVGLGASSTSPGSEGRVGARLDLRYALRGIVRDRAPVQVALVDGTMLYGTLDRVGADFMELAEHSQGEARRATAVYRVVTVPLRSLATVRTW